ncbi:MAG: c-type cytochrome biogenesis protein CcmI [Beggiatoa sp. IS2]|nr:MAG: c-type cytochrome biogenesis protein CcmI [Beggiatoa sp. IS2]
MLIFWIIATVLIGVALAFVLPPLLMKNDSSSEIDRNALNVTIYRERLAELEQENLTPAQRAHTERELEKTLAQEVLVETTVTATTKSPYIAIIVAIILPLATISGYSFLGDSEFITRNTEKNQESLNLVEITQKLVERHDARLLTELAEILAVTHDNQWTGHPAILLETALNIDPEQQKALWLAGFAAAQMANYSVAIERWQQVLALLSPEEIEARAALTAQIAKARGLLQETNPTLSEATAIPTTTAAPVQITVHVQVDPTLQAQVMPGDIVFIYARATQGNPMPLAIVKQSALANYPRL